MYYVLFVEMFGTGIHQPIRNFVFIFEIFISTLEGRLFQSFASY